MLLLKLCRNSNIRKNRREAKRRTREHLLFEKMCSQANEKGNWGLDPKGSFKKTDILKRERKKAPDFLG